MTRGSQKDYRATNNSWLSVVQLPHAWPLERSSSTLHLHLTGTPSSSLPDHQKQWARLSRLMVSIQQVREKCGMRLNKEWLTGLTCRKQWLWLWKSFQVSKKTSTPQQQNIGHTIESTTKDQPNQQDQLALTNRPKQLPTQGSSNHVRVDATHDREHDCQDSFTLCRGCTHSPWVVAILDSQILVVQMSTLTHFWVVH
jgi:hypothetical protein